MPFRETFWEAKFGKFSDKFLELPPCQMMKINYTFTYSLQPQFSTPPLAPVRVPNPLKNKDSLTKPEDYLYISARDYAGIKGLLDIEII